MTVYLNIRRDLKLETRDRMKKICREKGITIGTLLNEHFVK